MLRISSSFSRWYLSDEAVALTFVGFLGAFGERSEEVVACLSGYLLVRLVPEDAEVTHGADVAKWA